MQSILITGGAGFIGSHFTKGFLQGHEEFAVVNLDALTYAGNLDNLREIHKHPRYHFVKGDIRDRDLVQELFEKYDFDLVVNFAAESHVDRSIADAEVFLLTNVIGTQVLLDAAKANWSVGQDPLGYPRYRDGVKYLQVSTDEVYGTLGEVGKFSEASPLAPNSPYAASKASADMLVRAYHETYRMPVNITRSSNNYGPNQYPEKLIPLMILKTLQGESLPVYGDGRQVRDWIHVLDHCQGIEAVLLKGKPGEVFNIGGGNEKTNMEIIQMILGVLGGDESRISFVQDRLGHDLRYALDSQRIAGALGWSPGINFEEGLAQTIGWYLDHPEWWQRILKKQMDEGTQF
jgi:dTDP-glucose 4,6-dehydratase